jgi:hypothetical protein
LDHLAVVEEEGSSWRNRETIQYHVTRATAGGVHSIVDTTPEHTMTVIMGTRVDQQEVDHVDEDEEASEEAEGEKMRTIP